MLTLPTYITIFRFLAGLMMIIAYAFLANPFLAIFILFLLGAVTDWIDGFLARKMNLHSRFGAFLDPVADKYLVAVSLILLNAHFQHKILTVATMLIITREILMSSLRHLASDLNVGHRVNVNKFGKIKTAVQLISIGALLADAAIIMPLSLYTFAEIGVMIAAILSWTSFVSYYRSISSYLS